MVNLIEKFIKKKVGISFGKGYPINYEVVYELNGDENKFVREKYNEIKKSCFL